MWIILDIGGDPNVMEQRTSKYLDTEAGFMGKLPKSGVEILFNKTYVD